MKRSRYSAAQVAYALRQSASRDAVAGRLGINHKRVHRLYRLEGLQLRMRIRRRKHMCLHWEPVPRAQSLHERWSMDFVHDCQG
jgi:transposase InsO family protein